MRSSPPAAGAAPTPTKGTPFAVEEGVVLEDGAALGGNGEVVGEDADGGIGAVLNEGAGAVAR